jgi:hypothetical protein
VGLRGWSWDAQWGPAALGDRPLLEALQAALPDETVAAVIEATGTREQRRRRLPTHLVVTLVVAMGLWASESVRHALANVVAGWRDGPVSAGSAWQLPSNAAIMRARHRAGARLFRLLFHAVAGPIATAETVGAFLGGTAGPCQPPRCAAKGSRCGRRSPRSGVTPGPPRLPPQPAAVGDADPGGAPMSSSRGGARRSPAECRRTCR